MSGEPAIHLTVGRSAPVPRPRENVSERGGGLGRGLGSVIFDVQTEVELEKHFRLVPLLSQHVARK